MKFFIALEVAGPCRWLKFEKAGPMRRVLFLWFSLIYVKYSWTDFLRRYRLAIEDIRREEI